MSKLGRSLVVVIFVMIAIAVFVPLSQEPKWVVDYANYNELTGFWVVVILGLFLWLLEPTMILRDRQSGKNLCRAELLRVPPLPELKADQLTSVQLNGLPQYCQDFIVLEKDETKEYRLYFFVEESIVNKLGTNKNGTILVWNAEKDLLFVDRGLGYVFTMKRGKGNEYRCKRSRLH